MSTAEGFTLPLLFAALVTWLAGYLVCRRYVSAGTALLVTSIKASVSLFFFAYFNFGQWYMKDDVQYFHLALELKLRGFTALNSLFGGGGRDPMEIVVGSEHTLYYWWNLLAFQLFGEHYYSAVFLNIIFTYVCGALMVTLLRQCEFLPSYTKAFFLFFILHWDIMSWSSFVNLKDIVVLTLTIASFCFLFALVRAFSVVALTGLAACFYLLLSIRHYVPFFVVVAGGAWVFWSWRDRRKYLLLGLVGGAVLMLRPWETKYMNYFHPHDFLHSVIRFLLMPQFWTVLQPAEGFVEVPALLHWLLFVPMLFAAGKLWRACPLLRMPMMYFVLLTLFYAMVPELQGMRQRFQLTFVIALCQFHVFWLLLQRGQFQRE